MTISKIRKKYCVDDKVQVMFSNAPRQIILSQEGYLYLRDKDIIIHRYLTDSTRRKMPYRNNPSSSTHATHLFNYDQIYAKFTKYRNMGNSLYFEDSYSLTFLHFVGLEDGEALCVELSLRDFTEEQEITKTLSKDELERFLYDINSAEADAKCIFEWLDGIQYAKHRNEDVTIDNKNFLMLDDEEIIRRYNSKNKPLYSVFNEEQRAKKMADKSWMVHSIDEVQEFTLTHHGVFGQTSPIQLVIQGCKMFVYEFQVKFVKRDTFEVKTTKRNISLQNISLPYKDILRLSSNCEYTIEPDFDE